MEPEAATGILYVVATPLGNLGDITFRAVDILKQVPLIAAEDTRHSKRLLEHYGISATLVSCHEHNEIKKIPALIRHLKDKKDIALISDAGTPTISDPGYKLVLAAAKENIPVLPVPGCNAAVAALSISGLATDTFLFAGFLPKKQAKMTRTLEDLKEHRATLIFYESPKRIEKLLAACIKIFSDRQGCLAREITKLHEEYIRGNLTHILDALKAKESVKGECTLIIQGNTQKKVMDKDQLEALVREKLESSTLAPSALARQIAAENRLPRKQIYDLILKQKK